MRMGCMRMTGMRVGRMRVGRMHMTGMRVGRV
jgi:hypothetical protein